MKKIIMLAGFIAVLSLSAFAQPRPAEQKVEPTVANTAPEKFEAKYEGGMFGYSEKEKGTMKFDDLNERLVFFNKEGKEKFAIPYKTMLVIYPSSQKGQSTAGKVVSNVPILGVGLLGGLMTKKDRYLVIQFSDQDADVSGLANFKLDNKELLQSVIQTLGNKAKLKQRGDAYYRERVNKTVI
jgi:hypothetical protein